MMNPHAKSILISALITIVAIMTYDYRSKNRLDKIHDETAEYLKNYPPIRVINFERLTKELLARGHTNDEITEYGELMIRYFSKKGYIVLESRAIVTQPASIKLIHIPLNELRLAAKELGIKEINLLSAP